MAVTIVATVGSASANSFVTLAEAATYMEARLNASTWETDATNDTKNRALVEATRYLGTLAWLGTRSDDVQALAWPRELVVNPDDPYGNYYDTDAIPQRVKDATCELAFQFVKSGTTDVAALDPNIEVQSKTIDVLRTDYVQHGRRQGLARYPSVWRLIAPLVMVQGGLARVVRG